MCNLHLDEKIVNTLKQVFQIQEKERFLNFDKSVKNSKINKDLELFILENEFIIVHVGNFITFIICW